MKTVLTTRAYVFAVILSVIMDLTCFQVSPCSKTHHYDINLTHGSFGFLFVRGDTITVGTDSRVTYDTTYGGITKDLWQADSACKVNETNGVIIAIVGLPTIADSFNILDKASETMRSGIPFTNRIQSFDSVVTSRMSLWLNNSDWRRRLRDDEKLCNLCSIEIVFCTFIDGIPRIFDQRFHPHCPSYNVEIDTSSYQYTPNHDSKHCFVLPFGEGADSLHGAIANSPTAKAILQLATPDIVVTYFVMRQAQLYHTVGGDVDIVQLTSDMKARWIHRKKCCGKY